MMEFQQGNSVRVGFIGLSLVVLAVLTGIQFDRLPLVSAKPIYKAYFAEAGGLKTGDDVVVAGVRVGRVDSIGIADSNKVLVEFTAAGVEVGSDSRAAIKNRTVLGSRQLLLEPAGSDRLGSNKTIALDHTTSPYLLTESLGELTTTISGIKTDSVNSALDELSSTLTQTGPNLGGALTGIERLSDTINSRDGQLRELFDSATSLTQILDERSAQINSIILNGNTLLNSLVQRRQAIDDLLVNIDAVTRQLSGFVDDNTDQIGSALDELNAAVELLNQHRDDITNSIKPLQQYAQSLGESVASGPFFKAFVANLLPGQFLQPFIDAAYGDYRSENPLPGPPTVRQGQNTEPPAGGSP